MTKHLLVSLALLAGCVDAIDDVTSDPASDDAQGLDDVSHKISANGMPPGSVAATSLGLSALTDTAISNSGLVASANGRQFLSYVIGCAWGPNHSTTIAIPLGGNVTFTGAIGLADYWNKSALTVADRHWVTACVMARVNYFSLNVTISLQGNNAALALDYDQNYGIDEGAFFGDILGGGGAAVMGACMGVDQAHDNTQGDLPHRKCAADTSYCGFTYLGTCRTTCTTTTFPYTGCAPTNWHEVISVKLNGVPD
jgi:hypothetical protein